MSDTDVAVALRSEAPLVVVEAAAGCGKTYQAAELARDVAPLLLPSRMLILTHTNAARDVLRRRTSRLGNCVDIRTIDSMIINMAAVYHRGLGLPKDVASWAYAQPDGFESVACRVADLFDSNSIVVDALVSRFAFLVCDEHQDVSDAQHRIVMALYKAGAKTRIFGDPMQAIYRMQRRERERWAYDWRDLKSRARFAVELVNPHRWSKGAEGLGEWIQAARCSLKRGESIDLRGKRPVGLKVIMADHSTPGHGVFTMLPEERRAVDYYVQGERELLVLAPSNPLVQGLRGFWGRRLPMWEGHRRDELAALVDDLERCAGNPGAVLDAVIRFVQCTCAGFTESKWAHVLRRGLASELEPSSSERIVKLQRVARCVKELPDHRGAGNAVNELRKLVMVGGDFGAIRIDCYQQFAEAACLADFDGARDALRGILERRRHSRSRLPSKVVSTVHKAKGLECGSVLIIPCDKSGYGDTEYKRCLMYVALSRATKSLCLVLPRRDGSPLFKI